MTWGTFTVFRRSSLAVALAASSLSMACTGAPRADAGTDVTPADAATDAPLDTAPMACMTAAQCSDGNPCTDEVCYENRCVHVPNGARCAANNTCDPRSGCRTGGTCMREADCVDMDPCTTDEHCDTMSGTCTFRMLDADGDGHSPTRCGGQDCDDMRADIAPGGTERCDGADNDCDGTIDEAPATTSCGQHSMCRMGSCACDMGFPDRCGNGCTDTATDSLNCGMCGHACRMGVTCMSGMCPGEVPDGGGG